MWASEGRGRGSAVASVEGCNRDDCSVAPLDGVRAVLVVALVRGMPEKVWREAGLEDELIQGWISRRTQGRMQMSTGDTCFTQSIIMHGDPRLDLGS